MNDTIKTIAAYILIIGGCIAGAMLHQAGHPWLMLAAFTLVVTALYWVEQDWRRSSPISLEEHQKVRRELIEKGRVKPAKFDYK